MSWNGSGQTAGSTAEIEEVKVTVRKPIWCYVVLATMALIGALIALFYIYGSPNLAKEANGNKTTKKIVIQEKSTVKQKKAEEAKAKCTAKSDGQTTVKLPSMDTNSLPIPPAPARKIVFKSASDQVLSMAVNTRGEVPPLPYFPDMDAEFKASLEKPIVINDDDSDAVKQMKEAVIAARQTMKEMLKEGKSVKEVIEAHREQANFNMEMRAKVACEAREILESGDAKGARNYIMKMNFALEQIGIEKVEMPMTREERREKTIERIRQRKISGENER